MSNPLPEVRATARPAGLIDTLQAGFNVVNRNAWLLVLPIAIDLIIWLGPQVSMGAFLESWFRPISPPPGLSDTVVQQMQEALRSSRELVKEGEALRHYNLLSLLAVPLLGVPSFRAAAGGQGPTVPVDSAPVAAAVAIMSVLVGLLVGAVFFGMLAQAVRDGRAVPRSFVADLGRLVLSVLGLVAVIIVGLICIAIPFGTLMLLANAVDPRIAAILGPMFVGVALWAFVYLFFTTDALFVSLVPPMSAIQNSIVVVRHYFWSTLGFIALVLLISAGLSVLWQELAENLRVPGIGLGMLGHIYISTGLAAAGMTYYKERIERVAGDT